MFPVEKSLFCLTQTFESQQSLLRNWENYFKNESNHSLFLDNPSQPGNILYIIQYLGLIQGQLNLVKIDLNRGNIPENALAIRMCYIETLLYETQLLIKPAIFKKMETIRNFMNTLVSNLDLFRTLHPKQF